MTAGTILPGGTERRCVPDSIYREFIWRLPNGVFVLKADAGDLSSARITSANPAALWVQGLRRDQVIGKMLSEVVPQVLSTRFSEAAVAVQRTGLPQDLGFFRGLGHPERTYAVKVVPLPGGFLGVEFEDVSDALRLGEGASGLADAMWASPTGMCVIKLADGTVLDGNARFLELFGFARREELAGKQARALGIWADPAEHRRVMAELKQRQEIREVLIHGRTRDGRRFRALATLEAIRFSGDDCILALFWRT